MNEATGLKQPFSHTAFTLTAETTSKRIPSLIDGTRSAQVVEYVVETGETFPRRVDGSLFSPRASADRHL